MSGDGPVLSVRGLKVEFRLEDRTIRAVDGVGYDLLPGKTLAVVGESGSGKSVHALSLLGLLPRTARVVSGEALFHGEDLLAAREERLRAIRGARIAMIFQEPMTSLNPVLSVGEQVAEALIHHRGLSRRAAWEKAAGLLGKAGVPDPEKRLKDYPHQFSGGMRQRAMIAMALSCGPEVLIADEPTTALDVTIQAQILELISSLQKEMGMALILITHNIGVVAGMADDVVVMYAGRAVEKAPCGELFSNPRHPYTRALLGSVPSADFRKDRLETIAGQPPELGEPFTSCPFAPRCAQALPQCREQDPPSFEAGPSHTASCFLLKS